MNSRAENSYAPFRRRERAMPHFRQMPCLQKFKGKLVRCLAHDAPSYSGVGASGKPGAVHVSNGVSVRCEPLQCCNFSCGVCCCSCRVAKSFRGRMPDAATDANSQCIFSCFECITEIDFRLSQKKTQYQLQKRAEDTGAKEYIEKFSHEDT